VLLFKNIFSKKSVSFILFLCIMNKYQSCLFYVWMTNICLVFLYSSMTTICHVILVSMMNICDVLLLIFFLNKFLSCAFSKHIFKANYLFHFFDVSGTNISLVFFMYQWQKILSCFSYFSKENIYLICFIHHRQIFYPMILFFIFICDKYVSRFFFYHWKMHPLYVFYIYQWQIFVLYFLCINHKYLSRVFLFVNENYLSCVCVPLMNICVLCF